ncbi:MAG: transcriptional regulator, partial [Nitrospira sp.]|nr:transcriptional regulator [Nitrospira sp.]
MLYISKCFLNLVAEGAHHYPVGMSKRRKTATGTARAGILELLKTEGPQSAAALARRTGVTAMAVRQHLYRLQQDGLTEFVDERRKVGRPARIWRLTEASASRFPDSHGELAAGILDAVRDVFGQAGLEKLVRERLERQTASYREKIDPNATLAKRVAKLAEIRSEEGYMASSGKGPGGSITLAENNCPVRAAAETCNELCGAELDLFRRVLGPVDV